MNVTGKSVDKVIRRSKTVRGTVYKNKKNYNNSKKKKKKGSNKKRRRPPPPSTSHLLPFDGLQPGTIIESAKVVKLLKPYGALIQTNYNIPGKTPGCAMLHMSQIPPQSGDGMVAADISSILKVGQNITDARVIRVNRDENHVELSLIPQVTDGIVKPTKLRHIHVGDEIQGKVLRFKQYGAFVDIGCNRNALLHISRMSLYKVTDMTQHVNIGDTINVRVIKVDDDPTTKKTIAVSLLSKEKDDFLNRRDRAIQRLDLWNDVVNAEDEDKAEESKRLLLELDRIISNEMETRKRQMKDGDIEPRTLEV